MKNTILILTIIFGALTLTSNRSGRTSLTGQGVTGAPGESGQNCGSFGCHFNGQFDPDLQITMTNQDGENVNSYLPNETYTINLKINHTGSPTGYGFQIVSLSDSNNEGINTWSDLSDQMNEVFVNERQYVEQNTLISSDLIQLSWTAPESGTGPVSIYGVGNAVNGNGSSSGDGADTSFLRITENISSSIEDISSNYFKIYPNPTTDFVNIEGSQQVLLANLFDINGRKIKSINTQNPIDVSGLQKGVYLLNIIMENGNNYFKNLVIQ